MLRYMHKYRIIYVNLSVCVSVFENLDRKASTTHVVPVINCSLVKNISIYYRKIT